MLVVMQKSDRFILMILNSVHVRVILVERVHGSLNKKYQYVVILKITKLVKSVV